MILTVLCPLLPFLVFKAMKHIRYLGDWSTMERLMYVDWYVCTVMRCFLQMGGPVRQIHIVTASHEGEHI